MITEVIIREAWNQTAIWSRQFDKEDVQTPQDAYDAIMREFHISLDAVKPLIVASMRAYGSGREGGAFLRVFIAGVLAGRLEAGAPE